MNMITNATDDVVALVTNLYNSTCTTTPAQNTNANPFGMGSNTMNTGSMFGGGGGGGNTTGPSNLFGSSAAATNSNPFAKSVAGFGAPTQTQPSNLFGNSTASTNSMNLFGAQPNANTTGNNLFGGSSFANTGAPSAFGGASQTASVFGGNAASGPFSQQAAAASPFALPPTANQAPGLFGGQAQSNPVFGGGAAFGSQVKTGLFGQANATLGQAPNTGSIFGQSVQNAGFGTPSQTNPFGNASQTQSQSIFGGQQTMQAQDNPFAAVAQSGSTNIFGNAQAQQQPTQPSPFQSSTNMFGAPGNNTFGGAQQSIFGTNQTQNMNQMAVAPPPAAAPQSLQQQQQSIFGTNSFSAQPAAQPAQTPFGGNIFQNQPEPQQPSTQPPLFGGQAAPQQHPFGAQPPQSSRTLYTPMDLLDPDEIETFKSNTFDISNIPTKPPPMELCI